MRETPVTEIDPPGARLPPTHWKEPERRVHVNVDAVGDPLRVHPDGAEIVKPVIA